MEWALQIHLERRKKAKTMENRKTHRFCLSFHLLPIGEVPSGRVEQGEWGWKCRQELSICCLFERGKERSKRMTSLRFLSQETRRCLNEKRKMRTRISHEKERRKFRIKKREKMRKREQEECQPEAEKNTLWSRKTKWRCDRTRWRR